jgi:hypothetical protein
LIGKVRLILGSILHFSLAKGPVLAGAVDEVDEYIFLAHASFRNIFRDLAIKSLLYICRSARDPVDLNKDDVRRIVDPKYPSAGNTSSPASCCVMI